MLARQFRFHGYGSLSYLFRRGQTIRGQFVILRVLHNPRRQQGRVAVIVSRKVSKSAVVRNRIRRRIFEAVRLRLNYIEKPHDLAFIALKPELCTMPADELHRDIETVLSRANLIKQQ